MDSKTGTARHSKRPADTPSAATPRRRTRSLRTSPKPRWYEHVSAYSCSRDSNPYSSLQLQSGFSIGVAASRHDDSLRRAGGRGAAEGPGAQRARQRRVHRARQGGGAHELQAGGGGRRRRRRGPGGVGRCATAARPSTCQPTAAVGILRRERSCRPRWHLAQPAGHRASAGGSNLRTTRRLMLSAYVESFHVITTLKKSRDSTRRPPSAMNVTMNVTALPPRPALSTLDHHPPLVLPWHAEEDDRVMA